MKFPCYVFINGTHYTCHVAMYEKPPKYKLLKPGNRVYQEILANPQNKDNVFLKRLDSTQLEMAVLAKNVYYRLEAIEYVFQITHHEKKADRPLIINRNSQRDLLVTANVLLRDGFDEPFILSWLQQFRDVIHIGPMWRRLMLAYDINAHQFSYQLIKIEKKPLPDGARPLLQLESDLAQSLLATARVVVKLERGIIITMLGGSTIISSFGLVYLIQQLGLILTNLIPVAAAATLPPSQKPAALADSLTMPTIARNHLESQLKSMIPLQTCEMDIRSLSDPELMQQTATAYMEHGLTAEAFSLLQTLYQAGLK